MIVHKLELGGSGAGHSHYERILRCPRAARLDREAEQRVRDAGGVPHITGAFGRGTLYHAFLELYYSGKIDAPADIDRVSFTVDDEGTPPFIDPEAYEGASRTAREYIAQHSRNSYGTISWNERLYPRDDAEAKAISEAVGISPFTIRGDMAVKLGVKQVAAFMSQRYPMELPGAGNYLVDFKCYSAHNSVLNDELRNSHQFTAYILALNALAKKESDRFKGTIVDVAIATKVPKFFKIFVPAAGERERNILLNRWHALRVITTHLPDWANASRDTCFPIFGACPHYVSGACDRGATPLEDTDNV